MNSLQHTSTGFSPYEIMFDRKPPNLFAEIEDYPLCRSTIAQEREKIVKKTMAEQEEIRKRRHDKNLKATQFNVSDLVLVKTKEKSKAISNELKKFFDIYVGPFRVKEVPHRNAHSLGDVVVLKQMKQRRSYIT